MWPVVVCPGCRVEMGVLKVEPVGPGKTSGEIRYVCEICGTETRRQYKEANDRRRLTVKTGSPHR